MKHGKIWLEFGLTGITIMVLASVSWAILPVREAREVENNLMPSFKENKALVRQLKVKGQAFHAKKSAILAAGTQQNRAGEIGLQPEYRDVKIIGPIKGVGIVKVWLFHPNADEVRMIVTAKTKDQEAEQIISVKPKEQRITITSKTTTSLDYLDLKRNEDGTIEMTTSRKPNRKLQTKETYHAKLNKDKSEPYEGDLEVYDDVDKTHAIHLYSLLNGLPYLAQRLKPEQESTSISNYGRVFEPKFHFIPIQVEGQNGIAFIPADYFGFNWLE